MAGQARHDKIVRNSLNFSMSFSPGFVSKLLLASTLLATHFFNSL